MPWSEIVDEIRTGNERSVEGLYTAVSDCARARMHRSVDPLFVEDHVQDILMIVLAAIRSGELRDPNCLMGFVRTVTRRQVAVHIRGAMIRRRRMISMEFADPVSPLHESPEASLASRERIAVVKNVLRETVRAGPRHFDSFLLRRAGFGTYLPGNAVNSDTIPAL